MTESEKRWLHGRELSPRPYCASCINAKICAKTRKQCWCPTDGIDRYDAHILQDALEFSERVAAKLAEVAAMQKKHHCCVDIDIPFHCPGWQFCAERIMSKKDLRPCAFEMLRGARIEVEEEMNGKA